MRRWLSDLAISLPAPANREVSRSLSYTAVIAVVALVVYRDLYSGGQPPTGTSHPEQSINFALNARLCGKVGQISSRYSPQVFLTTRPDLLSYPFRDAIVAHAGSMDAYCQSVNEPVVVSENSLMWLTRFALRADQHLTPNQLGGFLAACRVFMLLVFGFALLRTGASVIFTLAALLVGCAILRAVGIRDSLHPFVLTFPLLHAGIYGIVRSSGFVKNGGWGLWLFALWMGLLAGFSGSMRTVLLPLGFAMFGVFLFVVAGETRAPRRGSRAIVVPAVAFVIGYFAHAAMFVYPLRLPDDPNVPNYTYHTIAHPLVMGLAVPENDLSRREGIEWKDEAGMKLARRSMPEVTYLGPLYERALLRYYGRLWRRHPGEMLKVYALKLRSAGTEVFLSAGVVGTQFGIPRGPAEWLHRATNGLTLLALGLISFGVALHRHLRGHGDRLLVVALVSLAALASLGEAFLMYSIFVAMYYPVLLFFVFFLLFLAVQAAVDAIAARAARPSRAMARVGTPRVGTQ